MRPGFLASLLIMLALNTACGTGFVNGWGDREGRKHDPAAVEAKCEKQPGWTWIGGSCKQNSSIPLVGLSKEECEELDTAGWWDDACIDYANTNEAQCGEIAGWTWTDKVCVANAELECAADPTRTWVDGACVGRPTIATEGALVQVVTAGNAIVPVSLSPSLGTSVEIREQTCADYFAIEGRRLVSKDGYDVAAGTSECTATLAARAGDIKGDELAIVATFTRGFFAICNDPQATNEELQTALALMKALEKVDCKEANVELVKAKRIVLAGEGLTDLTALRGLNQLEWLDLSSHFAPEPEEAALDLTPVADAASLVWLDLSKRVVKNLAPIAMLTKLERLLVEKDGLEKTEESCPTKAGTAAPVIWACTP